MAKEVQIMEQKVPQSKFPKSLDAWSYKDRELWYLGDLSLLDMPKASIIGSREVSKNGELRAERLTKLLVKEGYCIVSGLAKGIDSAAHITALKAGGKTIAVMGTPIEQCYPRENLSLKEEIAEKGLVLSQFKPSERVNQGNFPKRNALMAALSEITIVVEATEKSGTRHQVQSAVQMGRKVGFLASMATASYPWVISAMESGNGFLIKEPEDLYQVISKKNVATEELQLQSPTSQLVFSLEEPTYVESHVITETVEQVAAQPVEIRPKKKVPQKRSRFACLKRPMQCIQGSFNFMFGTHKKPD